MSDGHRHPHTGDVIDAHWERTLTCSNMAAPLANSPEYPPPENGRYLSESMTQGM